MKSGKTKLARFLRSRSGATAIENALMLGGVGVAALVAFNYLADDVKAAFMGAGASIEAAGDKQGGPGSRTEAAQDGRKAGN